MKGLIITFMFEMSISTRLKLVRSHVDSYNTIAVSIHQTRVAVKVGLHK
jgi:hypothetical protein